MSAELTRELAQLRQQVATLISVVQTFAARATDTSHVSIAEAAVILSVSPKTIRSLFTLQAIPGKKKHGVKVSDLFGVWMDEKAAKELWRRSKREAKS